jgi:hypothetical protein
LAKHYCENGLTPIENHSGGRRETKHVLSFKDAENTVNYIKNYAVDHALALPGRVPGYWRQDVLLLPSSHTKTFVYGRYKEAVLAGK